MAAVRDLGRGRHKKAMRQPHDDLIQNQPRMASAPLLALKRPLGSGAIERTGRRVLTRRVKGPSLLWCRASAEAILLLRSSYQAGRWEMGKRLATSHLALLES